MAAGHNPCRHGQLVVGVGKSAEQQHQDHDQQDQTEAAAVVGAAVVTGPVTVIAATAEQQDDDQDQQKEAQDEMRLSFVTRARLAASKVAAWPELWRRRGMREGTVTFPPCRNPPGIPTASAARLPFLRRRALVTAGHARVLHGARLPGGGDIVCRSGPW